MIILSIPGRSSTTQYLPLFCEGLQTAGAEIISLRDRRAWLLRFDVLHLHFPAHFIVEKPILPVLARCLFSLLFYLAAKHLARVRLVYSVHDVEPFNPKREWLLWPYLRAIHRLADGYVFLSDSSRADFHARFPGQQDKPALRIDHGAFPVSPLPAAARARLRQDLAGAQPCVLVGLLGSLKTYKGAELLVHLPEQLGDGTPVRVLVAGRIEPAYRATAAPALARLGGRLLRQDRGLSDAALAELIQAVDVLILPYTRGWNSGMLMLALGLRARVLATRRPLFAEFQQALGAPWIHVFDMAPERCAASLAQALEAAAAAPITAADTQRLEQFLGARDFARQGGQLLAFYEQLRRR